MTAVAPPEGYTYVGCPSCGRVMTVLHEPGEALPWCNHASGNPIWRAPHPETQRGPNPWMQTERVAVEWVATERCTTCGGRGERIFYTASPDAPTLEVPPGATPPPDPDGTRLTADECEACGGSGRVS